MSQPALILIDIQRAFLDPVWGTRNNPEFEEHVKALLTHFRKRNLPVIHIHHDSRFEGSPLRAGTIGNTFLDCATPLSGEETIGKRVNSAFIGTHLAESLLIHGARQLVFAGLTTDHCVSTSVRMAANLGYECTVAADATATFERKDQEGNTLPAELVHSYALASLRGEFAKILKTESILATL